ncbi:PIN domain-containing protein [Brevibacterium celere]|uniref:PIN domain-containing protein n=1 Tax=Brevibacterium celere TaxID=225845 RepID=UPI0031DFAB19
MQTVLFDTNVVFSRLLRDTVVHLHFHEAFRIVWTEDIMAELVYRLRRRYPEWNENQVGGVRRNLISAIGDEPITGYPASGHAVMTDPFDSHLDAAAEHGNVDYVVTMDRKALVPDPDRTTYEFYHLDEFLVLCDQSMPDRIRAALLTNLGYHVLRAKRNGRNELPNFPEKYAEAGVPDFAERVLEHYRRLDMSKIWNEPPTLANWTG